MAVTEQPVDIVATRGIYGTFGSFVVGNHALRSAWINSFYVRPNANVTYLGDNMSGILAPSFIGYGAVKDSNGRTTDQISPFQNQGTVTGLQQLYVLDQNNNGAVAGLAVQCSSLNPTFPAGTLPIAVLVLDGVQRIQQVIDFRPSNLSSAPNLGSGMTESVADATKRVNFANNYTVPRTYALSAQIPADVALPCSGFFIGAGAVVISGNTISTPTIYLSNSPKSNSLGLQLATNAINQGYVDPTTGQVTIRQVQTSGTFPANSLALFEATTDSVSLIRNITDWRPSYV